MTEERLHELLSGFENLRIAVVGDLFLDRWWEVDRGLDEPSVETGLTAYQVVGKRNSAGAAGTVLNNLSDLGVGTLYVVSMVGGDGEGCELLQLLAKKQINTEYIVKSDKVFTPTYTKPMLSQNGGKEAESNRFDIKNFQKTPKEITEKLIQNLRSVSEVTDALIVLDQLTYENTGVVTANMREALESLAKERPDLLIVADSRAFADCFSGVIIKCNDKEARGMVFGKDSGVFSLEELSVCMNELKRRTGKQVIITCGANGILIEDGESIALLPVLPVEGEIDVCGCGDACTSGMVSALCAGATLPEAAEMGNLCSSVTIRKIGTTGTASVFEIMSQYKKYYIKDEDIL